jgi:hypothetical protein
MNPLRWSQIATTALLRRENTHDFEAYRKPSATPNGDRGEHHDFAGAMG